MEGTLPFEYGFLYLPIEAAKVKYSTTLGVWQNQISMERASITYDGAYSNGLQYPSNIVESINWEKGVLPIAFIEKKQVVVTEVWMFEAKKTGMLVPSSSGYGLNFSQVNITDRKSKPFRMDIPVVDFIKDFEKIL